MNSNDKHVYLGRKTKESQLHKDVSFEQFCRHIKLRVARCPAPESSMKKPIRVVLGPPVASGRSLGFPSSQKFSARQGNAREKGMISRRTIETFVSMSVAIRDKQKYGIRRIIRK